MSDKQIQLMLILTLSAIIILGLLIVLVSILKNRKIDVLSSRVNDKEDIAENTRVTNTDTVINNFTDDTGNTIKLFKTSNDRNPNITKTKKHEIRLYDKDRPKIMLQKKIEKNLILGRSEKDCDIVVNYDGRVSGKHCELSSVKGQVFVKDLKSSNGTKINNKDIIETSRIGTGDTLYVGGVEFLVEIVEI